MPTPLTDADKVLRNDTGKDIVSALETIADNTSWAGHTAGDLPLGNTTPVGSTAAAIKEVKDDLDDLTGETLPLTTNPADGTVSEAIGDLSDLTTTNNDSLVDAVNETIETDIISFTASTTYLKNVSGFVHKTGKVVNVSITAQIKQQFNNTGSVLISDLPVPKDLAQVPLTAISGSANGQTNRIAVMTGGTVESYYSNNTLFPVDAYVLFSFTYFAKDM